MRIVTIALTLACSTSGCTDKALPAGQECAQDGTCPSGLTCYADFRCYPPGADAACSPPCYGALPFCHKAALRCVACLKDTDCPDGQVCAPPIHRCATGCSASHTGCGNDAESCDVDLGLCHGCRSDGDCRDKQSPRCDPASGRCVRCVPDDDNCPAGQYCAGAGGDYSCAIGCKDKRDCDGGDGGSSGECCGHKCVDSGGDSNNCGGCGVMCKSARVCCAGRCSDVQTDVDNCGACGVSCALPNVTGAACTRTKCSWTGCESYFADCDGNRDNGCETNLTHDPNNCYGCGTKCPAPPHATPGCSVANCGIGMCLSGWADCNGSSVDGCEYPTAMFATDGNNCGGCKKVCGGNQKCVNGNCV